MSAIKDILDKIDKLSPADQERLKTILLGKTFTKSISIEEFVTKKRFANGRVCPVCGATHVVCNGKRKDGTQKYICKLTTLKTDRNSSLSDRPALPLVA